MACAVRLGYLTAVGRGLYRPELKRSDLLDQRLGGLVLWPLGGDRPLAVGMRQDDACQRLAIAQHCGTEELAYGVLGLGDRDVPVLRS